MLTSVHQLMQQAILTDCFPGGVLLVANDGRIVHHQAYGWANRFNRTPMQPDTVFDLASLTKPLATTLALMILLQRGGLDLDWPLKSVIARFNKTAKADLRIRDLLVHRAGLPAWRPYYRTLVKCDPGDRQAALKDLLVREPLIHEPGEETVYSDLGFMLLAWVIEKVSRMPMGRYVSQAVYEPLGLAPAFFFPSLSPLPEDTPCAATELCPWRSILLNGSVHDENAYVVSCLQGHAGLFGTAGAVHRLLQVLLDTFHGQEAGLFTRQAVRLFLAPQGKEMRALGFDVPSGPTPSCGNYFSEETVGHLGFTGTSFWIDLARKIIVVLFTNRIHPSRYNNNIRSFRPRLHDAVMIRLKTGTP